MPDTNVDKSKNCTYISAITEHYCITLLTTNSELFVFDVMYLQFHPAPAQTQSKARQTPHQLKQKADRH